MRGKILGERVKDLRDLAQLRHLLRDLTQLNKELGDPESDGGGPAFKSGEEKVELREVRKEKKEAAN